MKTFSFMIIFALSLTCNTSELFANDQAKFTYNNHSYEIFKTARSWQEASVDAHAKGAYLARIDSQAENDEIYSRLNSYINQAEYSSTVASTGGGASYVWIGGNDLAQEGTWRWEDNNAQFWSGTQNGNSVGGLFNNWGYEPDDYQGAQDAAAIALTEWPLGSGHLGQASQWNDLVVTDTLYYIIEKDEIQTEGWLAPLLFLLD